MITFDRGFVGCRWFWGVLGCFGGGSPVVFVCYVGVLVCYMFVGLLGRCVGLDGWVF